jgi:catalase (peroxidase I)
MTGRRRYKGRKTRSKLLIMLATSTVLNKHPRYHEVYRRYFEKFEAEGNNRKKAHWKGMLPSRSVGRPRKRGTDVLCPSMWEGGAK